MPLFRLRGLLPLLAAPLWLAACSPTFNWRALPVDGAPLQALLPCKPEKAEREVPLAGVPTALQMRSCEAGGLTFAVAWADVREPARVPAALAGWRRASLLALKADPALADQTDAPPRPVVKGASQALGLQADGTDHRGAAMRMQAVHATRGTLIVQAAVYGPTIDERVAATFFEGLQFP